MVEYQLNHINMACIHLIYITRKRDYNHLF
jgi:hypothetical protein